MTVEQHSEDENSEVVYEEYLGQGILDCDGRDVQDKVVGTEEQETIAESETSAMIGGGNKVSDRQPTTARCRFLSCFGSLILLAGVGVGSYFLAMHYVGKNAAPTATAAASAAVSKTFSQEEANTFCQPELNDIREPLLELHISAGRLNREINDREVNLLEHAITDGYNAASGGCTDEYERFMVGSILSNKTVTEPIVGSDGIQVKNLILEFKAVISCDGCNDDEAFASQYPSTFSIPPSNARRQLLLLVSEPLDAAKILIEIEKRIRLVIPELGDISAATIRIRSDGGVAKIRGTDGDSDNDGEGDVEVHGVAGYNVGKTGSNEGYGKGEPEKIAMGGSGDDDGDADDFGDDDDDSSGYGKGGKKGGYGDDDDNNGSAYGGKKGGKKGDDDDDDGYGGKKVGKKGGYGDDDDNDGSGYGGKKGGKKGDYGDDDDGGYVGKKEGKKGGDDDDDTSSYGGKKSGKKGAYGGKKGGYGGDDDDDGHLSHKPVPTWSPIYNGGGGDDDDDDDEPVHYPTKSPTMYPMKALTDPPVRPPTGGKKGGKGEADDDDDDDGYYNAPVYHPIGDDDDDAPVHYPTKSPTKAPTYPPVHPPTGDDDDDANAHVPLV